MFGFLNIGFVDILDIILVGVLFFYVFRLLRGSQAVSIFIAIVLLYVMRLVCSAFNMRLTAGLLSAILDVGLIALIVIFQPEIRHFLSTLGKSYRHAGARAKWLTRLLGGENNDTADSAASINEICKACETMSAEKCGALIVIQKRASLQFIVDTGDVIDAQISERLLCNLFFKNSPLHDGAVILSGDRVVAARCTLPITQQNIPPSFGMRHKAAIGINETTDAQVIVVSEQTGGICVMSNGETIHADNINDLKRLLQNG